MCVCQRARVLFLWHRTATWHAQFVNIEESIEIADRDFLQFAEKHLEEFENDKK